MSNEVTGRLEPIRGRALRRAVALFALAGVFLVDLTVPPEIADGVLYVLPILLALWSRRLRFVLSVAAASAVLLVAVYALIPAHRGIGGVGTVNRTFALLAVLATTAVVVSFLHAERRQNDLARLVDASDDAVVGRSLSGTVRVFSRGAERLYGYTAAEAIGQPAAFLMPKERLFELTDVLSRVGRGEHVPAFETRRVRKDGSEVEVVLKVSPVRDDEGRIVAATAIAHDVSSERQLERVAKETLRKLQDYRRALDEASIVATTDARGRITYANDKFCEISKYSQEELLGQDHRLLNSGFHSKEFFRDLWGTIAAGRVFRGEIRNRAKDGAFYWVDTTIVPFLGDGGRPYQYMAIRTDITERKRAEETRRQAEEQLGRQTALAQLGELAAFVAHEVRNPLAGIGGAIQVLRDRLPKDSGDRTILSEILSRLASLNVLVQDLLVFARPRPPRRSPFSIGQTLRDAVALLSRDPGYAEIQVELRGLGDGTGEDMDIVVNGDAAQIGGVFQNLLLNAAQAMGGKGRIRISCSVAEAPAPICQITFADDGPGIPPELLQRVFEPFFTTRRKGSGLGLTIARRTVEAHGGRIQIASEPGEASGTAVTITLPSMPTKPAPSA